MEFDLSSVVVVFKKYRILNNHIEALFSLNGLITPFDITSLLPWNSSDGVECTISYIMEEGRNQSHINRQFAEHQEQEHGTRYITQIYAAVVCYCQVDCPNFLFFFFFFFFFELLKPLDMRRRHRMKFTLRR